MISVLRSCRLGKGEKTKQEDYKPLQTNRRTFKSKAMSPFYNIHNKLQNLRSVPLAELVRAIMRPILPFQTLSIFGL